MYPFGGLPENLASFCALLRREYGFRIGTGELLDAARALAIIELTNQESVRSALRTVLAGTHDDVTVFDAAFDRFFLSRHIAPIHETQSAPAQLDAGLGEEGDETLARRSAARSQAEDRAEEPADEIAPMTPIETSEEEAEHRFVARASYSPVAVESGGAPEVRDVDEAWIAAARALVRRVQLGPSRKWRAAAKGRRFDVRRTLRASVQTGSELLAPRWRARPRVQPRFIVLIDGSRSMSQYAGTALKLASALARATSRIEVFTFSTALQRVTTDVKLASTGRMRRFRPLAYAWGGGTTIGACLAEFLRRFGERLLSRHAVVIVASDGLDVGEPNMLRAAMQALRRRSRAVVWLNPLLDTPGYEPTALGMSIARPFATTFSSVNDLADFVRLSRTLRVRS